MVSNTTVCTYGEKEVCFSFCRFIWGKINIAPPQGTIPLLLSNLLFYVLSLLLLVVLKKWLVVISSIKKWLEDVHATTHKQKICRKTEKVLVIFRLQFTDISFNLKTHLIFKIQLKTPVKINIHYHNNAVLWALFLWWAFNIILSPSKLW